MVTRRLAVVAFILGAWAFGTGVRAEGPLPFKANDVVLFQGDSITDGGRGRNNPDPNHILGQDYAYLIAARFGAAHPEMHVTFLNRGISGNKVSDLQKRWQADCLDLKPTVLSILVGINDLNHDVPAEEFRSQYEALLEQTVKALPNVRLVLCAPFAFSNGRMEARWATLGPELVKRQKIVAELAAKYHAALVELQPVFDEAVKKAPVEYWVWDGIHPTYAGHQLMADAWVRAVGGK
ncbi:MAG: SGNH/GDSL hydrolase family protein [Phycisphaerae bacterium]